MRHSWSEPDEKGVQHCLNNCGSKRFTEWKKRPIGKAQPYLQYEKQGKITSERPRCIIEPNSLQDNVREADPK